MSTFPKAHIIDAEEGIVKTKPLVKRVAILGFGQSRAEAPYDNPHWEIWICNEGHASRFDRAWEMHPLEVQTQRELGWLRECKKPVYLLELDRERVPNGVRYPIEKILSITGTRDYFTSTFAYQIALAIYEDFEEIGLWGVPFFRGSPREQTVERGCLEWWLGLAEGKGIKVTTAKSDKLIYHPHRYGYDYWSEKRYTEGMMGYLGTEIFFYNRHIIPDGGERVYVGGDDQWPKTKN